MISIVIPTYNEENHIKTTIEHIRRNDTAQLINEIIVIDGGSSDATVALAHTEGVTALVSPKKGRSAQMNFGASIASQEILYFLHADTIPPANFSSDILKAIQEGHSAGCFMLEFDHPHWFLKANCWFTRFDINAFRYGDQSLFVKKNYFKDVNGFSEKHIIFEDYAIIKQIKKKGSFKIIRRPVITSARKYLENGIFKMQGIFFLMYFLYRFGFSQPRLVSTYKRLIRQDKI
ncbi:MAG: TIGR04283 family arsenosugar biosynthesis glycosyltransferase [Flavitalea sp.]